MTGDADWTRQNPSLVFDTLDEAGTGGQPPDSWIAALTKVQCTDVELGMVAPFSRHQARYRPPS